MVGCSQATRRSLHVGRRLFAAGSRNHCPRFRVAPPDQRRETEADDERGTQYGERQPAVRMVSQQPRSASKNNRAKRQRGQHSVSTSHRRDLLQRDRVAGRLPVRPQPRIAVRDSFGSGPRDRIDRRLRTDSA